MNVLRYIYFLNKKNHVDLDWGCIVFTSLTQLVGTMHNIYDFRLQTSVIAKNIGVAFLYLCNNKIMWSNLISKKVVQWILL